MFTPPAVIRVLLVRGDDDITLLLQTMLDQDEGFHIVGVAADAAEAVAVANSERADAVVVDLQPPEDEGLAAVPLLRRMLPDTKLVVCSAFPDPYTLADVLGKGADGYIDTGLVWSELLPTLVGLCAGRDRGVGISATG